jgi:hypothetical protein
MPFARELMQAPGMFFARGLFHEKRIHEGMKQLPVLRK